ncbi:MAG: sugar phosphate isomerase/epimerase family protein [bacterium]|nr:sugar phosphate isomerase/epimerase family protein [bacterium]
MDGEQGRSVADRVLLSAGQKNIDACLGLAHEYGLGIEVMAFAYPDLLDGDWQSEVRRYKTLLRNLPLVTMHGPFFDMAPGSPDKRVNDLVRDRYHHAIRIGSELGASIIVFHGNFIGSLRGDDYRQGWQSRNIEFWHETSAYAEAHQITIALENMWEYDPHILIDVIKEIDNPRLRACLDVGHAHLFSEVPFEHWLEVVAPYLVHTHLNNNDGFLDNHCAFPNGVLQYRDILTAIKALPQHPSFTLEMEQVEDMRVSLPYFALSAPPTSALFPAASPATHQPPPPEPLSPPTLFEVLRDDAELGTHPQPPRESLGKGDTAEFPPLRVQSD